MEACGLRRCAIEPRRHGSRNSQHQNFVGEKLVPVISGPTEQIEELRPEVRALSDKLPSR